MDKPQKRMTLIVFSNDMDKAMAAFILATGAASAGMEVTMFFTFWGLALLRKKDYTTNKKSIIERMFGIMLPKGPEASVLSKMNFFGAGTSMMKGVMKSKKMPQLHDLMKMALSLDVTIVACTTSMNMMGFTRDELIDNIDVGGVATYLGKAQNSSINLFI
ncbi:MAG: DsrE/DsrF/DrsH-like family protein [Candidatus Latescibacteria bacterium]|nr:DsrE/DsrF/DrsH-like family protein [Candidatus Latescibacterota bacterium]